MTPMKYEPSGDTLPCDRCGLQAKMHSVMSNLGAEGDEEDWHTVQYRNPRTRAERPARYCEACAKEVCGIHPPVKWPAVRDALKILGQERDAKADISELETQAKEAKTVVLRYLIQNDAEQVSHGGVTAKYRTRDSSTLDKDILADFLTDEQLRAATCTRQSQFVAVS